MAVRPSYVELTVDGRKTDIGTGPRQMGGRMCANFYVRDQGAIASSVCVRTFNDGMNHVLVVESPAGDEVYRQETLLYKPKPPKLDKFRKRIKKAIETED